MNGAEKEERRRHAIKLKQAGWKQRAIAEAMNVTEAAVSRWVKRHDEDGEVGLQCRRHLGAASRLSVEQKSLIPEYLSHGAESYGFGGAVWTCARVATVIEREFDVRYDKSQVSRILKELKWTCQKPIERASQRDEHAITVWKTQTWFELKKKLAWSAESLFSWMNLGFTCCLHGRARMHPQDKHRF